MNQEEKQAKYEEIKSENEFIGTIMKSYRVEMYRYADSDNCEYHVWFDEAGILVDIFLQNFETGKCIWSTSPFSQPGAIQ